MKLNLKPIVETIRNLFTKAVELRPKQFSTSISSVVPDFSKRKLVLLGGLAVLGYGAYSLIKHPPTETVEHGSIGLRVNQITGQVSTWKEGSVLVLPGLHKINIYSVRDQTHHPEQPKKDSGTSPLQTIEGLSLTVDLSMRYALDPQRITAIYRNLPDNIDAEVVSPIVQTSLNKILARYSVREIYSPKRAEIQKSIEAEIASKLEAEGFLLRNIRIDKIELPEVFSLRDRVYEPEHIKTAGGTSPLQSVEGLSIGVDLSVRYALDPERIAAVYKRLPDNIDNDVVAPIVQGSLYRIFARYTVREIFSTKRAEIQKLLETEISSKLDADGILLRGVQLGKIDLPADYKRGMESLLAEEIASEKMRYTLELKEKKVKELKIDGEAEKMQRELRAETAAREQIIAAKGQEEAMKHILPLKQRQVEQRQLEAEAEKGARIKSAEGNAQARRIEASGEAEARQKLADAEVYRLDKVGRTNSEQMEREGALVSKHPLLIQKTLADKLSDKIQVIIAPLSKSGGFIGDSLLGTGKRQVAAARSETANTEVNEEKEGE
jgi:regulator of protease activity HflC (stomatin/prohibitin superfamily)